MPMSFLIKQCERVGVVNFCHTAADDLLRQAAALTQRGNWVNAVEQALFLAGIDWTWESGQSGWHVDDELLTLNLRIWRVEGDEDGLVSRTISPFLSGWSCITHEWADERIDWEGNTFSEHGWVALRRAEAPLEPIEW